MWNEISCIKLQLPPEPLTRGLPPPDSRSLCPQLNLLNPPSRTKFLGTPLCPAIRLLNMSFLVEQESHLPSRHITMKQNVPATYFHIKYCKMSFRSQSIYLVINLQWWCFELTTFLDRTIPYGLCPGPLHHPLRAIINVASCLAALLVCHEPGSTLSLPLTLRLPD